jgi:hypothetical protein
MPLEPRAFELAKDPDHPEQYEDAFRMDPQRGIAVLADGVASAIFSRQWANILVEAVLADAPDPLEKKGFDAWLKQRRETWAQQVGSTKGGAAKGGAAGLAWFQRAKLPLGAFSTLLWVCVLPRQENRPGQFGALRLQSYAIGDSCLFHVRHGQVLRTFPIQQAAELQADPLVLGSVDLGRDQLIEFGYLDDLCYADDLLVMCTDAVADWALRRLESGDPPAWDHYWDMTPQQWQQEVISLRDQGQMRYDDATLLLLRVTMAGVEIGQPASGATASGVSESLGVQGSGFGVQEPSGKTSFVHTEPETVDPAEDNWKGKFKSAGEQLAEGVGLASQELVRGWKSWKGKAVQKYRQTFKRNKD